MYTVGYLLANSHLPGPRGNLELLYAFSRSAEEGVVRDCLALIKEDTANSPEEFAGMCGIVGYAKLGAADIASVMDFIRPYATHASWRIREATAIAVQEIAGADLARVLACFRSWLEGAPLEKRAVVATLCEPKLLDKAETNLTVLEMLRILTDGFTNADKLDDDQKVLRQALGYGWSVAIAAQPKEGKHLLEDYRGTANKHIRWIIRENLKKNRLSRMDAAWTASMAASFE